mgnify:CR=1 FL=1
MSIDSRFLDVGSKHTFLLYLVVALVASTPCLIFVVARWFNTVWFGMIKTLLSSLVGVVPLRMLLLRNMGSEGGAGCDSAAAFARSNLYRAAEPDGDWASSFADGGGYQESRSVR